MKKLFLFGLLSLSMTSLLADSECTKCLQKVQTELAICLGSAKTPADKKDCDRGAAIGNLECKVSGRCPK
jgi:hypothetical protein